MFEAFSGKRISGKRRLLLKAGGIAALDSLFSCVKKYVIRLPIFQSHISKGNNKMKILFGTGNPAKFSSMKSRLAALDIELVGLHDLKKEGIAIPEVPENGNSPLENARQKAEAYYKALRMPVFSCDSGLYFDNVPDEIQPGVHVRMVNGICMSDEQMLDYYAGLAKQYGNLMARYKNAICLVMDENRSYEAMEQSMESERFILTDRPHSKIRKKGFPLDSLSIDIRTGKYYYDLPEEKLEQVAVEDGFLVFFQKVLAAEKEVSGFNNIKMI